MPSRPGLFRVLVGLLLWHAFGTAYAATERVTVEACPEYLFYRPGSPLRIALTFHVPAGKHLFWTHPGSTSGLPPRVEWTLPDEWEDQGLLYPAPKRFSGPSRVDFGYEGEVTLLDTLVPPMEGGGGEVTLKARVLWQLAQDGPGKDEETRVAIILHPARGNQVRPVKAEQFRAWQDRIPRVEPNLGLRIEKKFFSDVFILRVPGSQGSIPTEIFPTDPRWAVPGKPLMTRFEEGEWVVALPDRPGVKRGQNFSGVLEPGPAGGLPVTFSIRFP